MSSMFAPKGDIATFTGERTKEAQAKALAQQGVKYGVNPRGEILVLRSEIEQRITTASPQRKQRGHNFAALTK